MSRTLVAALALFVCTVAPARAQQADPFTVTAADGAVYRATAAELDHWARLARRSGRSRAEAFRMLVEHAWISAEAAERDLVVTHQQVVREFRQQRDSVFSTRRQYRRFLRESGQTVDDLLFRMREDMLRVAIRAQVVAAAAASVTDADVDAHLAEHGFPRIPERRDIRIVLTARRSAAVTALRELEAGATWSAVARRYSIDEASRRQNGRLHDVARRDLERRLQRAVFAARPRRVMGPVRTQFGYYVFRVTRVHPAHDVPEAEARANARAVLVAEAQQTAFTRFAADFEAKWRARTVCAPRWRTQHRWCGG
jgi:foldase protein PrsA